MKRLYRSRRDQVLGGVAAGMAHYFNVDPTLLRIIWVLVGLAGPGVILYIVCWLIIPEAPPEVEPVMGAPVAPAADGSSPGTPGQPEPAPVFEFRRGRGAEWLGIGLVLVGGWFLLEQFVPWFRRDALWPLLLIGLGVFLLVQRRGN